VEKADGVQVRIKMPRIHQGGGWTVE
jgi:hypothetical protein